MERTLVASTRYRPTTLANILYWLKNEGYRIKSTGEAIRTSLEILSDSIGKQQFSNELEALSFLENEGFLNEPSQRNKELIVKIRSTLSQKSLTEEEVCLQQLIMENMKKMEGEEE